MEQALLEVKGLTKEFPGVKALDSVDFNLYPGEVHVLVGENGAGKSTLAKCILGVYQPDGGEIFIDGKKVFINNPKEALDFGIAAVYQELTTVPYLNAAQNIFLNREPMFRGTQLIDHKKMRAEAAKYLSLLGANHIDLNTPVANLDVAEQQMIEIAKALSFNPKIIIFDEPTASLSERETESLFKQIHLLKKQNIGMIYVSHRMQEYHRIGDRITVLRDGKFIRTIKEGDLDDAALVNLMVGRDISQVYQRTPNIHDEVVLETVDLKDQKGRVQNCSITLKKGEIVGLAGLVGSGRTELARLIFGIDKPSAGKVFVHKKDVTGHEPHELVKAGLGLLPEDRKRYGLALKKSIAWNTVAVSLKQLFPKFLISEHKNLEFANRYIKLLNVATPNAKRIAGQLSGGNQQKVVIGKWLSAGSNIIIFDEPTRGIDVGAKMEIYKLMDELVSKGNAILMISSELQEIVGMSDRIYVMKDGEIVAERLRDECSAEEIGRIMVLGKDAIK